VSDSIQYKVFGRSLPHSHSNGPGNFPVRFRVSSQHFTHAATGPGTVRTAPEIQRDTLARSVPSASAHRDCQPRSGPNSLIAN
jgi:hypothetical protein